MNDSTLPRAQTLGEPRFYGPRAIPEREYAVGLANKVLSRRSGDPDDDLAVLARQLLRALERIDTLNAVLRMDTPNAIRAREG